MACPPCSGIQITVPKCQAKNSRRTTRVLEVRNMDYPLDQSGRNNPPRFWTKIVHVAALSLFIAFLLSLASLLWVWVAKKRDLTLSIRSSERHFVDYPSRMDQGSIWEFALILRESRVGAVWGRTTSRSPEISSNTQRKVFADTSFLLWPANEVAQAKFLFIECWSYEKIRFFEDVARVQGGVSTVECHLAVSAISFPLIILDVVLFGLALYTTKRIRTVIRRYHGFPIRQ
jgi:hypothetical protein